MVSPSGFLRQARHRGWLALLLVWFWSAQGWAQEGRSRWFDLIDSATQRTQESEVDEIEDFLETDRNAFTLGRKTVGRNRLMIETAYSFLKLPDEGVNHSLPEFLVRYGLTERLEFRLGWNLELSTSEDHGPAEAIISNFFGTSAQQQLVYGIKYQLTSQENWRPESAIVIQGHTPTGGRQNSTHPRVGGVFGWRLSNDWNLDSSFWYGPDSDLGDHFNIWAPSVVVRIPLGRRERWFTHLEYFGVMSSGLASDFSKHFVDTGLHYFVTPNFEIGTIVAFGINPQSDPIIVNVGAGWRY